jgi:xylulose-5-phosphate/fructose-6-phosphate phosphoketolase
MNNNYDSFDKYLRTANYITAAQIFLQDNFLLERKLTPDDIKPRLLGHWGSGPGVNFTYSHLSHLAKVKNQDILFVLGPGHAFPALQANLYLEGTLQYYYPNATHTYDGLAYLCKNFSWPYGFPSHSNPGTPGVILEGGELGYALSTSYGAALDNKNLIVACMIGDGEAETGPTAGAWHLNKLAHPSINGVVLPILHLNGYKISAPTVYGRMSDDELACLFRGYGYEPYLVQHNPDIHRQMQLTLEKVYAKITEAKQLPLHERPLMPMIILRTEKGWSGVKQLNGQKVEGNFLSHQVVLTEAKTNVEQLELLQNWLESYNIHELFNRSSGVGTFIADVIPDAGKQLGRSKHAFGGSGVYEPLDLPTAEQFSEDASIPGTIGSSSMRRAGLFLEETLRRNPESFRFMSPDETYSNKLDAVFNATKRGWMLPIKSWDKDLAPDGRVLEMLSEHNLQGLTQGYVITGRHAVFASYEAFIQVIASMVDQYAKFLHQARNIDWRGDVPSLNYILTSSGWRQEHNGFSHQNPGFIDDVLQRQGDVANVFFPADGNSTLAVLEKTLSSTNNINVIVAGKTQEPRWLTPELAKKNLQSGVMQWDFASDDDPHVVLTAAGDYLTTESLAAIDIVKSDFPDGRLRFVNIMSLSSCGLGTTETCLTVEGFNLLFTPDKPVVCNFHGYPQTLKSILFDYIHSSPQRFSIHGYIESGSTTTPFDMHVRNKTDRYHIAIDVVDKLSSTGAIPHDMAANLIKKYQHKLAANTEYIKIHGVDLDEISSWRWTR